MLNVTLDECLVPSVSPRCKAAGGNCACREGSCKRRYLLGQAKLLLYLFWEGETAPCQQLQDCLLWPAFMEGVHRLFSRPFCTPSAMLWASTYEHAKIQFLLFTRYFESLVQKAQERNRTAKSLLLVKFHTDCMLQACRKKVKRFCFICLI